jgi:cellulose synthase/poly-beta-1,6-N-acetylglucosamine synthase-like glycosyltransferase
MKFSIVIPLYNKAPYITDTIKSVLAQTLTDYELIVVDDGSSDGGAELVAAMTDQRLELVRQDNAGVSVARNRGIEHARGEWVLFLDADDWLHPRLLAYLQEAQKAHPQVGAVATRFIPLPDKEHNWPPRWPDMREPDMELITDLPTRWMQGPTLCTGSIAIRTERLRQMQPCFPAGESQGEDLDLWFRVAEQTPITLVKAPLLAKRTAVEGSLTAQHDETMFLYPAIQRMRKRALSGVMSAQQRRSALWFVAQQEVSGARYAVASGQRLESMRWLIRGRHAVSGKRWWLTAFMTLFFPGKLVRTWEHWRIRRALPPVNTVNTARTGNRNET